MEYKYALTATSNDKCLPIRLHKTIRASSISSALVEGVRKDETDIYIEFAGVLSAADKTTLNGLVADHVGR